ncbi:MAG: (Fe-S)-binding protein [Candidatus Altiarchaeota archaeon]
MDEETKLILRIFDILPLIDCGQCGLPKCRDFARELVAGDAEVFDCPHLNEETTEKIVLLLDDFFK